MDVAERIAQLAKVPLFSGLTPVALALPVWSTVHTFDGPGTIGLHEVMLSLRSLGFSLYSDGSITELLGGKERPIEVLRLTGHHPLVLKCKALLKEFEGYQSATGRKLKEFRLEVLRAGFRAAWGQKDYQTIINVAQKIPEEALQEDEKLLLWYDQALTRTEAGA